MKDKNYNHATRKLGVGFHIYSCLGQWASQRGWPCIDKSYIRVNMRNFRTLLQKRASTTGTKPLVAYLFVFLTPKCKAPQIDSFWDHWGRLLPNIAHDSSLKFTVGSQHGAQQDRVRCIGDINWESLRQNQSCIEVLFAVRSSPIIHIFKLRVIN